MRHPKKFKNLKNHHFSILGGDSQRVLRRLMHPIILKINFLQGGALKLYMIISANVMKFLVCVSIEDFDRYNPFPVWGVSART